MCATEIQRVWKGFAQRSLLEPSKGRVILTWRWGSSTGASVYVAGEFSSWRKWRMHYCSHLNEYRVALPLKCTDSCKSFMYKFIVDGLWTCDGSLPMIECEDGNVNNVYQMRRMRSRTPSVLASTVKLHKPPGNMVHGNPSKIRPPQNVPSITHKLPPPTKARNPI